MTSEKSDNEADPSDFLSLNYFSTKDVVTNKINEVNIFSRIM